MGRGDLQRHPLGRSPGERGVGKREVRNRLVVLVTQPDVDVLSRRARRAVSRAVDAHPGEVPTVALDAEPHGVGAAGNAAGPGRRAVVAGVLDRLSRQVARLGLAIGKAALRALHHHERLGLVPPRGQALVLVGGQEGFAEGRAGVGRVDLLLAPRREDRRDALIADDLRKLLPQRRPADNGAWVLRGELPPEPGHAVRTIVVSVRPKVITLAGVNAVDNPRAQVVGPALGGRGRHPTVIPYDPIHRQVTHLVAEAVKVKDPAPGGPAKVFLTADRQLETVLAVVEQPDSRAGIAS